MNSFFLCAEDVKAGIQGVGPNSFSASVLAPVQGATMAEWAHAKREARTAYVLEDTFIEYNKGICTGFNWMFPQLEGAEIVGSDTFKNDDASIASQITRGLLARGDGVAGGTAQHATPIERLRKLLANISTQNPDLAPVSVALRELRHLA